MYHATRFPGPPQALCIVGVAAGFMGPSIQSANGAIALFAPESIVYDLNSQESGEMAVAIAIIRSTGTSISNDSFDLLFGSHTVPMTELAFSQEFLQLWDVTVFGPPNAGFGKYENEILAEAIRNSVPGSFSQAKVATLGIDLDGLEAGDHWVVVDSDWSFFHADRGSPTPISGELPIRIVPEPSVAVMLIFGALAALLNRRSKGAPTLC